MYTVLVTSLNRIKAVASVHLLQLCFRVFDSAKVSHNYKAIIAYNVIDVLRKELNVK